MLVGERIGSYVLEACLGEGATSSVFRARHADLGSIHAVKVLDRREASLRQRFLDEARYLARVKHPYVVQVHDLVTEGPRLAMVLEHVDGPSLDRWRMLHAPFRSDRLRMLADLLVALSALHRSGLVHRDVKPQNVLVREAPDGWRPVVIDLGIARSDGGITRAGSRMGTPWYMAPEQMCDATTVDARADLYALGVVAYELLADRRPFSDETDWEASLDARRRRRYVRLADLGLPRELSDWVDVLLAPEPGDRPHSAEVALGMMPAWEPAARATLVPPLTVAVPTHVPVRRAPVRSAFGGLALAAAGALGMGLAWANSAPASTTVIVPDPSCAAALAADAPPDAPPEPVFVVEDDHGSALRDAVRASSSHRKPLRVKWPFGGKDREDRR